MGAVLGTLMLLFAAFWGSRFLSVELQSQRARLREEQSGQGPALEALTEEIERLTARVAQLEDEVRFFTELHAPKEPPELPPGEG